ncbi:MAG: MBL fold metallo-hydrolase, partial [Leeuwenhoekiella sp.]
GGCIKWDNDHKTLQPVFKNATYWSNEDHWLWATQPNAREKASFLKENILPIEESGQLKFIKRTEGDFLKSDELSFDILFVDGHTDKQMIPHIKYDGKTIVFMADLLPTVGHLPLPYVMGFDTRPLLTLGEKENFLNTAAERSYFLWLEHDAHNALITVEKTEKGVRLKEKFKIEDIIN